MNEVASQFLHAFAGLTALLGYACNIEDTWPCFGSLLKELLWRR
jgi:hypothetical protein